MRYKIIEQRDGALLHKQMLEKPDEPHTYELDKEVGRGATLHEALLKSIAHDIRMSQHALSAKKKPLEQLDAVAFELLHRKLPADAELTSDFRFWVRFAVVYLHDVALARFPASKRKGGSTEFNVENLGLGGSMRSRVENYPYKLWLRGELSYEPGARDPYRFGRFGGVDFWTSHIHRQGFTNCRTFARELIRFQYPLQRRGKPTLYPGDEKDGKRGIRTLVKRLRLLWASVEYSLLDEAGARAIIIEHASGLNTPDGKPFSA